MQTNNTTMRERMARKTNNWNIVGRARKAELARESKRSRELRNMVMNRRNELYAEIFGKGGIAYCRAGKIIPRRKEWRELLNEKLATLTSWAILARGDYERQPRKQGRDAAFPPANYKLKGRDRLFDERRRLIEWSDTLESRQEWDKLARVSEQIVRLERRLGMRQRRIELIRDGNTLRSIEHYVFVGDIRRNQND